MIKIGQVANGTAAFIEAQIFPLLDSTTRMVATAGLVYVRLKPVDTVAYVATLLMPNVTLDSILATAKALKLIDDEFSVDVDILIEMAKETARKDKIKLKFLGYGFALEESHFDTLKTFIEKAE